MIPYMIGKIAPSSSLLTREFVKYVLGRGYFRAGSSQNEDKYVTSPPPPPIVELVLCFNQQLPPRVGVRKRGAYSLVPDLPRHHSFGTTLRFNLDLCRRTLDSERSRYAIARPDKLGTGPMAYGGFKYINGRRRGTREESRNK